ncbi:hypothetical protein GW937_02325, partial [Candidatus Kaiserbacteria bacterium]|nr:hypothetical protein [Candidatus Kaiserbacteria bacterium]
SPDGITWTSRNVPAAKWWSSVTYGNGLFVAVNDNNSATGAVMTSPDGITWTSRNVPAAKQWTSVTYGNGLFVAVNDNYSATGAVMTSHDTTLSLIGQDTQTLSGTLTGASALKSVTVGTVGTTTFANNASTTNLTIATSSTVVAPANLSIATAFTNSGTFTHSSGTVLLTGPTHTLTGTTTFFNLTKETTEAATTTFEAGSLTTIAGEWRFSGIASSTQALSSSVPGQYWYINPEATTTIAYLNVKDSYNTNVSTIVCDTGCIDGTNNINWSFDEAVTGSSTITDHDVSQVPNAFNFQNQTNEALFAFKLIPESSSATVTDLVISLSGVHKIDANDFSNLRLLRDLDNDAQYDVTDEAVGGTGVMVLDSFTSRGTITFSEDFLATASQNYILIADWNAPANGSSLTIQLLPSGVTAIDENGVQDIFGSIDHVQHNRNNRGSGGGSRSAIGGADIPPGRTVETGGEQGGGGTVDGGTGELIGNDPYFRSPTAHSGDWQSAANAYDQTDGTYATTSLANTSSFLNHGFSVSLGNLINGIEVKLEISGSTAAGNIGVQLSWDGGVSWTDTKTTATLTTSDKVVSLGDASDTWGHTWSTTDFSNANFVVRLTGGPSSNTIMVDAIQVRVYHQAGGGGSGGGEAI